MRAIVVSSVLLALAVTEVGAAQGDPVEELLRLHHQQRVAHVLDDAGMLANSFADRFIELNGGRIRLASPAQLRDRLAAYLAEVEFLEWEDVRPPRIRFAPEGGWAEVIVEKRVRTIPADTQRATRQAQQVFAWVERWVRANAGWRLAMVASTDRPGLEAAPASLAERVRAHEILHRAREATGGEASIAHLATLQFTAECEGPGGAFRTTVASARDGRVSFVQQFPTRPGFAAGISLTGAWQQSGDDPRVDSLDAVLETVVRGHEMHLLALAPEARFTAPAAQPSERLDGHEAHVVRFRDALGAPVDFLYDAVTGRPLGFRLINHTGHGARVILTRFDEWRPVGEVVLPHDIHITQGGDVYRYRIIEATTDWLTDRVFRRDEER